VARKPKDERPTPTLVEVEDLEPEPVVFAAVWPELAIRFLLVDGTCVDVRTSHDDSDLRKAIVDRFGGIAGATRLAERVETGDDDGDVAL
jgi:hypothetical protein